MNHKDLDAWKEAINLVKNIYSATGNFPDSEKFGLVSQMRRASVSIPSNIAEGSARSSDRDNLRFLDIACSSCAELETQLIIAHELEFIENVTELLDQVERVKKLITGMMNFLKRKSKTSA